MKWSSDFAYTWNKGIMIWPEGAAHSSIPTYSSYDQNSEKTRVYVAYERSYSVGPIDSLIVAVIDLFGQPKWVCCSSGKEKEIFSWTSWKTCWGAVQRNFCNFNGFSVSQKKTSSYLYINFIDTPKMLSCYFPPMCNMEGKSSTQGRALFLRLRVSKFAVK